MFFAIQRFQHRAIRKEIEYTKWEGYKTLVLKVHSQVAAFANLDSAEVGDDVESDVVEVGDAESDDVEVGDDAEDVPVPGA
jgi:hypothetical protein